MTMFTSVLGWASFGVAARGLANALERKNPLQGAGGHAAAALIFGSFGYYIFGVQQRQEAELEKVLAKVRENKRAQLAQEAAE
ncbi:hypothetical protein AMAG_17622 [Allomyces macrogynus ATCC 38327]|uniref:Uncharacterized protein n=1 Tax=Allomyces macrogynus (strain ATCC 38327) TaxID=578462 RepID=A0A0L0RV11_ALLM3|nr:hypothetical protein AMAG_17622 [Allomyces macrogynus ATCC 38327]|eukprot:KNE54128.1 hypothetical protein AMAG_17622 [Allomyces macrogynus ATCC 38327]